MRWLRRLVAPSVIAFGVIVIAAGPAGALPVGFLKEVTGPLPSVTQQYYTSSTAAVSCPSTTTCTAIGQYGQAVSGGGSVSTGFAVSESGGTWGTAQALGVPSPLAGTELANAPASSLTTDLTALSCSDATDCTAVGTADAEGSEEAVVDAEVGGTWQPPKVVATPYLDTQDSQMNFVSCSSTSNCVAIGSYLPQGAQWDVPFYITESSGTWSSATTLPLPSDMVFGTYAPVTAFTCSSATACMVVGQYQQSGGAALYVEPFSSGTFGSPTGVSFPEGETYANVDSLWCADASDCVGVGDTGDSSVNHGLALTEASGTWSDAATDANTTSTQLNYVTCTDTSDCTTFGTIQISGVQTVVQYTESSGVWSEGATGSAGQLGGASCVSSTCVLGLTGFDGYTHAGVASFDGTSFSDPVTFALPSNVFVALQGAFVDATCPSSTTCEVLGYFDNQHNQYQAYVETYVSGVATGATVLSITEPKDYGNSYVGSISCASVGNCALVFMGQGYGQSLDVEVDGTWQAPTALANGVQIDSVSCVTGLWCEAVGTDQEAVLIGDTYYPAGIAMTYSASSWSSWSAVTNTASLSSVSCWSEFNCEAVGSGYQSNEEHAVGVELDAGAWQSTSFVTIPSSANPQFTWFNGVSCISSGSCLAVGGYEDLDVWRPITASSSGGTWSEASFDGGLPANGWTPVFVPQFDAVNCVDSSDCVLTGVYTDKDGVAQPMEAEGTITTTGFTGQALTTPYPAGSSPTSEWSIDGGIGCMSASNCMLVGSYETGTGNNQVSLPDLAMTGATPPAEPVGVTATGVRGAVTVKWTAGSGGATATSYTATVGTKSCTTSALTCTVTGLANDTTYTVSVIANSTAGTSGSSDPISVLVIGPASAPTLTSVVPGNGQVTVNFTAPTNDDGSPITSYLVTATEGSFSQNFQCLVSQTSCVIDGLLNGVDYSISMVAVNGAGDGVASRTVVVEPTGPPYAPTGVEALAGKGQLTIKWTLGNNGGSPILHSTAYAGTASCVSTTTTCTITGLTNGRKYTVTVDSTNALGTGAMSTSVIGEPLSGKPKGAPGPVRSLTAKPFVHGVTLTWRAPADVGTGIASYTICEVSPVANCGTNPPTDRSAVWYVSKTERFSVVAVATDGEVSSKVVYITATPKA